MVKKRLVGGEQVNIYKHGQGLELGNTENKSSYNPGQKFLGRLHNLRVVYFDPKKRVFSLLLEITLPLYSMLGYNRTITHTNIKVLLNIHLGHRRGDNGKKEVESISLPNTFDDDYSNQGRTWSWGLLITSPGF